MAINMVSPLDPSAATPGVSQQNITVNLIGSYGACLIAIMISIAIWGTNIMQAYVVYLCSLHVCVKHVESLL